MFRLFACNFHFTMKTAAERERRDEHDIVLNESQTERNISAIHCDSQTLKLTLFILMSTHEQSDFRQHDHYFCQIYAHFYV